MSSGPGDLREMLAELSHAGFCSNPIRLFGTVTNRTTGTSHTGTVTVACKDRRAVICPACSRTYKGDAWHLLTAGLKGGKGVTADVAGRPLLFATFTAPSFGPVHTIPDGHVCRRRADHPVCLHLRPEWCDTTHAENDPMLGEPLCEDCFDYQGAVLWNAHASKLWQRTTIAVVRALASDQSVSEKELRSELRLSFVKVTEFQRRGLIHVHALIRADGPDGPDTPPPRWLDPAGLATAVETAAGRATVRTLWGAIRWGRQLDVKILDRRPDADPTAVAAYVAKYAVKTSETGGALARPVRSLYAIRQLGLRPHVARLVRTAWTLGGDPAFDSMKLRAHAHTFGYPGHLLTKSRAYSTTFGALRQARASRAAAGTGLEPDETGWRYTGRGYRHPSTALYADALTEAAAGLPTTTPAPSPTAPQPPDLE